MPTETKPPDNLLRNPGFEDGSDGWYSLEQHEPFEVVASRAHEGGASALLRMRGEPQDAGTRIYSVVQDVESSSVPGVLRGAVRVENWQRGTAVQYVQIVFAPIDAPPGIAGLTAPPQLRYVLAGATSDPIEIHNARFVFAGLDDEAGEPRRDTWLRFELDLRDDYARTWDHVPDGGTTYRVLLEVRWDGKEVGTAAATADVYFDDLYLGAH